MADAALLNELWQLLNILLLLLGSLLFAGMFTTSDLMERWKVTRDTVLDHIHSGKLKAIDVGRSPNRPSWRISAEAVEIFEQASESEAWNAPPPKRRKRSREVTEFF